MGPERGDSSSRENRGPRRSFHPKRTGNYAGKGRQKFSRQDQPVASDLPGVQKLKAALRQTRRLLERDNLAADVRIETERRLKSLESDLRTAESIRKERMFARRYHKVKFFERQKVLRKIRKVKRELEQGKEVPSKEMANHLEETLYELRIQLNYIQKYPKLEKYVSLFPPSKEESEQNPDLSDAGRLSRSETDARREQILREIKARMSAGELSGEPEREVENRGHSFAMADRVGWPHAGQESRKGGTLSFPSSGTRISTKGTEGRPEVPQGRKAKGVKHSKTERVDEDDFFEDASPPSSDSSSDSSSDLRAASDGSSDTDGDDNSD